MTVRIAIRQPVPLPALTTGDAALDAAVRAVVLAYESGGLADTSPLDGAGGRLASALVPELLDGGETRWDDDAARVLSAVDLAARKAEADQRYRANNVRRGVLMALLAELECDAVGQARLREALSFSGNADLYALVADAVYRSGTPADLEALAAAFPEAGGSVFAFAARMRLSADYAPSLTGRLGAMPPEALATVFRAAGMAQIVVPVGWESALVASLPTLAASYVAPLLRQLPPGPDRLDALLALPADRAVATELAGFDTPAALRRLADMVSETTLADSVVRAALQRSIHADAAHAALAIVAALSGDRPARKKPFEALAKELCAKHGVTPPKKPRGAKAGPLPAVAWPPAPPPIALPPSVPGLYAEIAAALAEAGVTATASVLSPAVRLGAERVDESALSVGDSKLGGRPDLPEGVAWPEHGDVAMTFVAQLRLADVAGLGVSPPLPSSGLLAFFVADEGLDEAPSVGAVRFFADGVALTRQDPPPSYQKHRVGRSARQPHPACRLSFAATAQLAAPSHPAAPGAGYASVQARYAHPPAHTLLGFPDGWQGDLTGGLRQLLAVYPEPQAALAWGDEQALWFRIREADLAAGRFGDVAVQLAG
jgi:hypothetical protein